MVLMDEFVVIITFSAQDCVYSSSILVTVTHVARNYESSIASSMRHQEKRTGSRLPEDPSQIPCHRSPALQMLASLDHM